MDINRKQILETFIRILKHIANKDYQKRVWIRGEGPEVDDFDETCCYFFGEVEPILDNYTLFNINENQYQLLKELRDKFRLFSDENDWPPFFINTPEWDEIVQMAKKVLDAFDYKK